MIIPKELRKLVFDHVGFISKFRSSLAPCSRAMVTRSRSEFRDASLSKFQFSKFFGYRLFFILILALSSSIAFGADEQKTPTELPSPFDQETTPVEPVSYQGAFVKMMLTLFALIVFIILSVWMMRRLSHGRMKQMNYGRAIKILERRPLSAKSILYVIEVNGKKILISESQFEVRTISKLEEEINP
ncbi:MAG TPA: flagellar biosynthetic protein FliO [Rhabdochlamydiaceae bacterium]|nr:flagellar biosynthetic protein FliO [Rhabdochlamydiaceae bacterium]